MSTCLLRSVDIRLSGPRVHVFFLFMLLLGRPGLSAGAVQPAPRAGTPVLCGL